MNDNFWNEDSVSEFDILGDVVIEEQPIVEYDDIQTDIIEEIQEQSSFELDEEDMTFFGPQQEDVGSFADFYNNL